MGSPLFRLEPLLDLQGLRCVEIGVQRGDWAAELLKAGPAELHLVDCWAHQDPEVYKDDQGNAPDDEQEAIYQSVVERFKADGAVKIVRSLSVDAAATYENWFFDFIYLDANHNYGPVLEDLAAWWPKLRPGGWFAGHDLNRRQRGAHAFPVREAVSKFCADNGLEWRPLTRKSWGVEKRLARL